MNSTNESMAATLAAARAEVAKVIIGQDEAI